MPPCRSTTANWPIGVSTGQAKDGASDMAVAGSGAVDPVVMGGMVPTAPSRVNRALRRLYRNRCSPKGWVGRRSSIRVNNLNISTSYINHSGSVSKKYAKVI